MYRETYDESLINMLKASIEQNRQTTELLADLVGELTGVLKNKKLLLSMEETAEMLGNCNIKIVRKMADDGVLKTASYINVDSTKKSKEKILLSSVVEYLEMLVKKGSSEFHVCPQTARKKLNIGNFTLEEAEQLDRGRKRKVYTNQ